MKRIIIIHPRNYGIPALLSLSTLSVTATLVILFFYSNNMVDNRTGLRFDKTLFSLQKFDKSVDLLKAEENVEESTAVFSMNQTDQRLWDYVRKHHLTKPSELSYNLTAKGGNHANSFSWMIHKMFNKTKRGTFIEAGAYDGEAASNSLYLEKQGWQGILVECNPIILPKLRNKNRKAWISNVCLSLSNSPETLNFSTPVDWPASAKLGKPLNAKEMKDIGIDWMKNKTWLEYQIPCFPLYSIIKAVGVFDEIDFLNLDVEGSEISILEHFPFNRITIKSLLVEVFTYTKIQKVKIQKLMSTKGYELLRNLGQDHLYGLRSLHFKV